eukprot:9218464-Alexandrium_andersonii.AAC.1
MPEQMLPMRIGSWRMPARDGPRKRTGEACRERLATGDAAAAEADDDAAVDGAAVVVAADAGRFLGVFCGDVGTATPRFRGLDCCCAALPLRLGAALALGVEPLALAFAFSAPSRTSSSAVPQSSIGAWEKDETLAGSGMQWRQRAQRFHTSAVC